MYIYIYICKRTVHIIVYIYASIYIHILQQSENGIFQVLTHPKMKWRFHNLEHASCQGFFHYIYIQHTFMDINCFKYMCINMHICIYMHVVFYMSFLLSFEWFPTISGRLTCSKMHLLLFNCKRCTFGRRRSAFWMHWLRKNNSIILIAKAGTLFHTFRIMNIYIYTHINMYSYYIYI